LKLQNKIRVQVANAQNVIPCCDVVVVPNVLVVVPDVLVVVPDVLVVVPDVLVVVPVVVVGDETEIGVVITGDPLDVVEGEIS